MTEITANPPPSLSSIVEALRNRSRSGGIRMPLRSTSGTGRLAREEFTLPSDMEFGNFDQLERKLKRSAPGDFKNAAIDQVTRSFVGKAIDEGFSDPDAMYRALQGSVREVAAKWHQAIDPKNSPGTIKNVVDPVIELSNPRAIK